MDNSDNTNIEDLPGEIWKPAINFEDKFQVSNLGRIKAINYKGKNETIILNPSRFKSGYRINVKIDGKQHTVLINRLIYFSFHPDKEDIKTNILSYKDGDRFNIKLDNLVLISKKESIKQQDSYFKNKLIHIYRNNTLYKTCKKLLEIQLLFPFSRKQICNLCDSQEEFYYENFTYQFRVEKLDVIPVESIEERIDNLPGEIWKEFNNYFISNLGRVKAIHIASRPYTYLMNQKINAAGYHIVALKINGKYKDYFIHELVATLFLKQKRYAQVKHIDGNKDNNSYNNLEWVIPEDIPHIFKNALNDSSSYPLVVIDKLNYKLYWFPSILAAEYSLNIPNSSMRNYLNGNKHNQYIFYKIYPNADDLPGEIWKGIPNFEDKYQVSNLGRVKSLSYKRSNRPAIIQPTKDKNGYKLTVRKESKQYTILLARVIYFIFHPEDADKDDKNTKVNRYIVAYKDGNCYNLSADNLYLIPRQEHNLALAKQKDYYFRSKLIHVYKNKILYKDCKTLNDMQELFPFEKEKIHKLCDSQEEFIYENDTYQFKVEILKPNKTYTEWYEELLNTPSEERVENLPGEIWKPLKIKGIDFSKMYQVSNMGRIKTMYTKNKPFTSIVKQRVSWSYRHTVYLMFKGEAHELKVSTLVAELFVPNPNNLPVCHHLDDDPENNKASNLMWVTQKQNMEFAAKQGHIWKQQHYFAPITVIDKDNNIEYFECIGGFCRKYLVRDEKVMWHITHKEIIKKPNNQYKVSYNEFTKELIELEELNKKYSISTTGLLHNDIDNIDVEVESVNNEAVVHLENHTYKLAWLVLATFYPIGLTWHSNLERNIIYVDGNKMNCRLDNLLWE